jgi:cellulose synthase/poly-beta-1,6-N-acetylglucosamine synthase-like glycosyltransferase
MTRRPVIKHRIVYAIFCIPFIFAFITWVYLPPVAEWLVANLFRYKGGQQPNIYWYFIVRVFFSWYTFLAIGVAGAWVITAAFSRKKHVEAKHSFYPFVSFVVPAYNQQENVSGCVRSLLECAHDYDGMCEIIVVDDGSTDGTYEKALLVLGSVPKDNCYVRGKVVRHMSNLGKIEALKTGVNKSLGNIIAIVDADSQWDPLTLKKLVDYKLSNGKKAVTGYVDPSAKKPNAYVALQKLEYSQGLGVGRCAQSLFDNVLVVSGAIGIYEADLLRGILFEKNIRSVTEDLEITLEMHKKGAKVGYNNKTATSTVVPTSFSALWKQRTRWFTGWLHNTMDIYEPLSRKRSWLMMLLWYTYIFEFVGAFIDLAALIAFPFLFWFAPNRISFLLNLVVFILYGLLVGLMFQAIALKYAYGKRADYKLLLYVPIYPLLWLLNVLARTKSFASYLEGNNGKWH